MLWAPSASWEHNCYSDLSKSQADYGTSFFRIFWSPTSLSQILRWPPRGHSLVSLRTWPTCHFLLHSPPSMLAPGLQCLRTAAPTTLFLCWSQNIPSTLYLKACLLVLLLPGASISKFLSPLFLQMSLPILPRFNCPPYPLPLSSFLVLPSIFSHHFLPSNILIYLLICLLSVSLAIRI